MQNKREIYALLFRVSAETLIQVVRDSKHLGPEIGFKYIAQISPAVNSQR
jgi:hypothetical protein